MTTALTARIEAINSRADRAGNRYWAFRYTDYQTGKRVEATISGGESNINAIRQAMGRVDGWDASIEFDVTELPIREWNRLTKDWPYAGCVPAELAAFIKAKLPNLTR